MSGKDSNSTVYVGGFSQDTTATTLHSAFIPFGDILDISLPSDPAHKGSHRGFAFITFASPEAALDACDNMHRNCLQTATNRGKVLKVNKAKPPKGAGTQGSNKPIWASEEWIAEHGTHGVGDAASNAAEMIAAAQDA
ncbi:hypothetical protein BMF94_1697 [Rhodotorula taiwanensis]|uniref:RRM domain-containing protein n=1 Tax=Rhodotorula taiwanensis TaxID=741276 RepID=A0A2S5BEX2_9BASI|nr:hypothetical protein BMF94_1697 [Rhodotorula taiwanensis]